jgi:carbon monoxide dehydrogenase subunit G
VASIYREIRIDAPPELVWDALRDVGALHRRLARGFVTDVRLEEGARVVTFANGIVARELMTHHNASAQVFPDGGRGSRFVWIADLLPHELAPAISAMMDQGLMAIKRTLEDGRSAG